MAKNELHVVSQFQRAIVCHQRTKICGAREIALAKKSMFSAKLYIVVIFAKIDFFRDSAYLFSSPLEKCSWCFYPRSSVACPLGLKGPVIWDLHIFEKKFHSHFECPFPHTYPIFCTLCWQFNLFLVSEGQMSAERIQKTISMTLTTL